MSLHPLWYQSNAMLIWEKTNSRGWYCLTQKAEMKYPGDRGFERGRSWITQHQYVILFVCIYSHGAGMTHDAFLIYLQSCSISGTKSETLMFFVSSCSCLRQIHWSQVLKQHSKVLNPRPISTQLSASGAGFDYVTYSRVTPSWGKIGTCIQVKNVNAMGIILITWHNHSISAISELENIKP